MLSLTKKSEAQPVAAPLWHTNFRDYERLPDTKVVSTTFFINTAALAIAIGMVLWLGYREYTVYNIGEQIVVADRQIENGKKQNLEAIRLSTVFAEEEAKFNEAAAFVKVPITPEEFINLIGESLPKDIAIDFIETRIGDQRNAGFQLKGRVAGSPDQASGIASNYGDMLRAHPRLGQVFDPITLNRLDRDTTSSFMVFDISLTVKATKK